MSIKLVIQHDLSKLSPEELSKYLRDVSEFIGLSSDLNGLDTIWMDNESGPGKSLVVYARRGTAEILRSTLGIEVLSLTDKMVKGSIVFTATGKNHEGRQEIATGSKNIENLQGKQLDDAIMTASTRALRRLTMQFTSLGILDESEVKAVVGDTSNPAAGATLAGSAVVLPPVPTVPANNAPGRDVTAEPAPLVDQKVNIPAVYAEGAAALAARPFVAQNPPNQGVSLQEISSAIQPDIKPDIRTAASSVTPVVAPVTSVSQPDIQPDTPAVKPRRARKAPKTVSLDGPEPEVVSNSPAAPTTSISAPAPVSASVETAPKTETAPTQVNSAVPAQVNAVVPPQADGAVPTQANPAVPAPGTSVPNQGTDFPGKPTVEQMADYRKRVGVYTAELPSSENMGSVQKMRAFITRMSGAAPQFMTTDQWEEMLDWFEQFVAKNKLRGLVGYINDSLGVK